MGIQLQPKHVAIYATSQMAATNSESSKASPEEGERWQTLRIPSHPVFFCVHFPRCLPLNATLSHGADNGADKEAYHDDHSPLNGP